MWGVFMTRVAYRANKEKYGIQKMICTQNDISVKWWHSLIWRHIKTVAQTNNNVFDDMNDGKVM